MFGINPDGMSLLVAAWGAYQAFKAMAEGTNWDIQHQATIDAAKAALPDLAAEPYGEEGWMRFAPAFSPLTMRNARRWWSKNEAWMDQAGVMEIRDGS